MEEYRGQQLLVPPETSLERTLRTGKLDVPLIDQSIAGTIASTPDVATVFDDILKRPEHYYGKVENQNPPVSALGSLMFRGALRVLGEGTTKDVEDLRGAIWPSFYKHIGYSFGPFDSSANISDDTIYEMQKGLELVRAAYGLLTDPLDTPGSGYEFNVLRSHNGLGAKALCMIVDRPEEVLMRSELESRLEKTDTLNFSLHRLVKLEVIDTDPFRSPNEYYDGVPDDTAYRTFEGWRCRTNEDSELMVLARYHAKKYDEYVAADAAAET